MIRINDGIFATALVGVILSLLIKNYALALGFNILMYLSAIEEWRENG